MVTDELARFSSVTAGTLFQTELQNALAVETDEEFVSVLSNGATSFGSSGVTAENVRNDLRVALGNVNTGSRSRLFLPVGSTLPRRLPSTHNLAVRVSRHDRNSGDVGEHNGLCRTALKRHDGSGRCDAELGRV